MVNVTSPFTWSAGWKSPIYCDNRLILSYPSIRTEVIAAFCDLIRERFEGVEVIAGVATAGIAHGALVAQQLGLPFAYVRSKAKGHGRKNQIEGRIEAGQKCVVIEDLISTGKSSVLAVNALKERQAEVLGTVSIFSYGFPQAKAAFAETSTPYYSLTSLEDLLQKAVEINYLQPSALETIYQWQKAPERWLS